jgi:tetratricopeptide (TPR) repeat protein
VTFVFDQTHSYRGFSHWFWVFLVQASFFTLGCASHTQTKQHSHKTKPTRTTTAKVEATTPTAQESTAPNDASNSSNSEAERPTIVVEPLRIEVVRDEEGREKVIAVDARSIFDEANDALADGNHQRAIELYDELLADFAESSLVAPAMFNAGLGLEGLGQIDAAVERYLTLARMDSGGRDGVDAQVRAAALLAEQERWSASLDVIEELLKTSKLAGPDRVEALARRGYVLVESKDYAAAERSLREAIALYRKLEAAKVVLESDYFLAMAHFYLGDIPRRQFDAIPIRLPETQLQRDVETKAGLVILASERFGDTVELGNIYWATAAGFHLGDMQSNFWRAVVSAPVPPHLSGQASKLYVEEVHRQSLSLLQKSLGIHQKNVQLATIYKGQTSWSEASERAVARLTTLVAQEEAGEIQSGDAAVEPRVSLGSNEEYLPEPVSL